VGQLQGRVVFAHFQEDDRLAPVAFRTSCYNTFMYELKNILGIAATVLVFIGYVPYLQDILRGKTKPHLYSWFLWTLITFIAFALQYSGGAGSGSFVTLAVALMCIAVIVLGLRQKNRIRIVFLDTVFLVLALASIILWLVAKQPVLSSILVTLIDVFGFVPTVRKSWNQPYTETLSFYWLTAFRFVLALLSIQHYSVVTTLYPASWLLINAAFAVTLAIRRNRVGRSLSGG
jgi:hypothetical protein